jgi:L-seryl-tRNA(Ser) seleniumtransferase
MSAIARAAVAEGIPVEAGRLPSVDRVLTLPAVTALVEQHGRRFITDAVRGLLQSWRDAARRGEAPAATDAAAIAAALARCIAARLAPQLRPVHNLTGTVLHTNLGRAPLAEEAIAAVAQAMRGPVNLEFDVASGARGDRDTLVEHLLCELTGAEAATIVNNNAAAVLLTIAALGARREVLISRGELVEIGGAFRMPDVMASAGARMVEVGTTNRTHAKDFLAAIGPKTALVMKVHASNYVVQGFTAAVPEAELAALAHAAGLPFAVDLGSGSLVDLGAYGLPREPLPQDALRAGADVVTFSGDKLLGGPQAGIIVGRRDWIARIRKHPLKRALRASKLVMAALEATLALYRHPEQLPARLPTLRLLTRPEADIRALADRLAGAVAQALAVAMPTTPFAVTVEAVSSQIGSGSLPIDLLPSAALVLRPARAGRGAGRRIDALAAALRALPVPVIGRIRDGALVLDLRALEDEAGFREQLARLRVAAPGAAEPA